LRVYWLANQIRRWIKVALIAFETTWSIGFELTIRIFAVNDSTSRLFTYTIIANVEPIITTNTSSIGRIVFIAIGVYALAVSILIRVHSGYTLSTAPIFIRLQAVSIASNLLYAIKHLNRNLIDDDCDWNRIVIGVTFYTLTLFVCLLAGITQNIRWVPDTIIHCNIAISIQG